MVGRAPVRAFIGIGSNLDAPATKVQAAIDALGAVPDTRVVKKSSLYRTVPVGYLDQPDFVNAVVAVETALAPRELLDELLAIEQQFGRVRSTPNAPRTLDLDLLLYGNERRDEEELTIPHPRMQERAFVLVPLAEIAPDVRIGNLGTAMELLSTVSTDGVRPISAA